MQSTDERDDPSHNLFRSIVEQAPDALIYADRDGAIRVGDAVELRTKEETA